MKRLLTLLGLGLLGAPGQDDAVEVRFDAAELKRLARFSPLPQPPADPTNRVADDPRAARLGQRLFFDPRLSASGEISCATCHDPKRAFSDGKPLAEGLGQGTRKTPSIVNAAYLRWLFWDGRADSLWAQVTGPIENPLEMGSNRLAVAHLLAADAGLRGPYEELFGPLPALHEAARFPAEARPAGDGQDHSQARAWRSMDGADREAVDRVFANVGKLIAAYERLLVRADSPFDRFVAALKGGEADGGGHLSRPARLGLKLFMGRAGCSLCHSGATFSDLEFHNTQAPTRDGRPPQDAGRYLGARLVKQDPFNAQGPHSDDSGGKAARRVRRLKTDSESWGAFKTPSLRNLKQRGPYFHAGQLPDLDSVLRFYSTLEGASGGSHHQERILQPLHLGQEELGQLRAFLESLEGRALPPELERAPGSGKTGDTP